MIRNKLLTNIVAGVLMSTGAMLHAAQEWVPGYVKREVFPNQTRDAVVNGTAGDAASVSYLTEFFVDPPDSDNYTDRLSGYFVPPATAHYIFFVAADDDTDVFLSTDENPANKRLIAQEGAYSSARNWNTPGGAASTLEQKRSDYFIPSGETTAPYYEGFLLEQGQRYYIEAVHHQGGGGDHVGVTYGTVELGDYPADGNNTKILGDAIGVYVETATLSIPTPPSDQTVTAGLPVLFTVGTETDTLIPLTYQWRKGGAAIEGATGATYNFIATPEDDGAEIDVVVTAPGISVTSEAATLTVQSTGGVEVPGLLKVERFNGATLADIENGRVGAPDMIRALESLETVEQGVNFAQRVTGYFTPEVSGSYVFFVTSDDGSRFFISTDENPANKRLVAEERNWSNPRSWDSSAGNSDLTLKRSDTWSPDGGLTFPYSEGIALEADQKYYIEVLHGEGTGGDNLGATFKLTTDVDPVGSYTGFEGDPSRFTGDVISYLTTPASSLEITAQPANVTIGEGNVVTFNVAVETDAEINPVYQWRKNGVAIEGATSSSYTTPAVLQADSNSKYDVVVSVPGTELSVTSSQATVTVESGVLSQGLKREYFPGQTRQAILDGTAGEPTIVDHLTVLDQTVKRADNYAQRVSGFFIPPTTSRYTFFLAADDDTDVFLSTDENPANKRLIAQETSWSGVRSWISGGNATQKHSDTFSPDGGVTLPFASGIELEGGERYYLEIVQHQGTGGDNLSLTYIDVNVHGYPVDGEATRMRGDVIAFLAPEATVTITESPEDATMVIGQSATFSVAATTTSTFALSYQWFRNGVAIEGATGATYTTPLLTLADNNATYSVEVVAPGAEPVTAEATLTVPSDTELPTVTSVGSLAGDSSIGVHFSETLDPESAVVPTNYSVEGAFVIEAILRGNNFVELVLGEPFTGDINLTVSGVKDFAGNTIATTTVEGQTMNLMEATLGTEFVDPILAGAAFGSGDRVWITAGGSDLWNAADAGHFVYQEFTGAFDARVRLDSLTGPNDWTKAGLMVRESLEAGSRNQLVAGTRAEGVNLYTFQWRDTAGEASGSLPAEERISPVEYPTWLRLVREDTASNEIKAYVSWDGETWTQMGAHTTPGALLPETLFVGLAVTSHDNDAAAALAESSFTGFSVDEFVPVADPGLTVSRDGDTITINWQVGTLVASPTVNGNYQPVEGATSPYEVSADADAMFYQVLLP